MKKTKCKACKKWHIQMRDLKIDVNELNICECRIESIKSLLANNVPIVGFTKGTPIISEADHKELTKEIEKRTS